VISQEFLKLMKEKKLGFVISSLMQLAKDKKLQNYLRNINKDLIKMSMLNASDKTIQQYLENVFKAHPEVREFIEQHLNQALGITKQIQETVQQEVEKSLDQKNVDESNMKRIIKSISFIITGWILLYFVTRKVSPKDIYDEIKDKISNNELNLKDKILITLGNLFILAGISYLAQTALTKVIK